MCECVIFVSRQGESNNDTFIYTLKMLFECGYTEEQLSEVAAQETLVEDLNFLSPLRCKTTALKYVAVSVTKSEGKGLEFNLSKLFILY